MIQATHKLTHRPVAIKVFSKAAMQPPLHCQKLDINFRETLQEINSPATGLTELVEIFEDDRYKYLVTSLMKNGDLQLLMQRNTKVPYLTEEEILSQAKLIFSALATIHSAGFLHNNI